jgi:hypothetical protein
MNVSLIGVEKNAGRIRTIGDNSRALIPTRDEEFVKVGWNLLGN